MNQDRKVKDMAACLGPPARDSARNSYREEEEVSMIRTDQKNDCSSSNLSGRHMHDDVSLKVRDTLLSIATWNVRTLYEAGKLDNAIREMEKYHIDILGIAEVRWTEAGKVEKDNHTLIYSGGGQHQHGVGIIMTKKVSQSLFGFWPISDRVILMKLRGKPFDIAVIQVYAPTTSHTEEELETFYEDVQKAIKTVKSDDILFVIGDLNAKVGKDKYLGITGAFGLGKRNERGTRLIQFCERNQLVITNTWFEHPARHIYTWKSPGDIKRNQIDYIMIRSRFRNSVVDVKTFPGADIGSDHNLLRAKIKVKLKIPIRAKRNEQRDMSLLRTPEYKNKFALEVRNRFEVLNMEEGVQTEEAEKEQTGWLCLKKCMQQAVEVVLPNKQKTKKMFWMNDHILSLMEERRKHKGRNQLEYKRLDNQIKIECRKAKNSWIEEICKEVEVNAAKHQPRKMYNAMKSLKGNKRKKAAECISDKNGNILFEEQDINKRWVEYVGELYNDDRGDIPDIEEKTGPSIMTDEVKAAITAMKDGKAGGDDNISTEMLKCLDEFGIQQLTKVVNNIYEAGEFPDDLRKSVFIPIPKKAGATNCSDFRTISLMSHVTKLLLKIIQRRNDKKIEAEIGNTQSGFRKGMGTREGIFNLRMVVERCIEMQKDVYLCFIDYEKAFDRVNHEGLIRCMQNIGMDGKDLKLIANLYWHQTAVIRTETGNTTEVAIKRGVRQGCVISPTAFNLYTEPIFRELEDNKGVVIGGMNVNNFRYVDDTVIVAETEEELQRTMDKANEEGQKRNMKINIKKTKVMVITKKTETPKVKITVDGKELEQVDNYIYLGHMITTDGKCDSEISRRIEMARSAFHSLTHVLTARKISLENKLKLTKCFVWSVLLYGMEAWSINKSMEKKLEAFEMWCYRRMLRISWKDKIKNEDVIKKMNVERRMMEVIRERKMKFCGHILRHDSIQKTLLEGKIEGKRARGKQRHTWWHNIQEWTRKSFEENARIAQHRDEWRFMADNLRFGDVT
jgi:endonuclease/exonuclease/phosphatase family metal-dependent hydrolase